MKKLLLLTVVCMALALVWGGYSLVLAQTEGGSAPKPPATTSPASKLATSVEEIAGTWFTKDCYFGGCYVRIDKDGTGRGAYTVDKLDNEPYGRESYEFKGTEMAVTEVLDCGGFPPLRKDDRALSSAIARKWQHPDRAHRGSMPKGA